MILGHLLEELVIRDLLYSPTQSPPGWSTKLGCVVILSNPALKDTGKTVASLVMVVAGNLIESVPTDAQRDPNVLPFGC
jgi:hypothetical protein